MCLHCHLPHRTSLRCEGHPLLGVHFNGSSSGTSGKRHNLAALQRTAASMHAASDALSLEPLTALLATGMMLPCTLRAPDFHHVPLLLPARPPAPHCVTPATHVLIHAHYTCAIFYLCSLLRCAAPATSIHTHIGQHRCGHTRCLIRSLAHSQPWLRALPASAKDALACCCQV